jgi:general secretion pathway protein I
MTRRPARSQRGFSLLELLVAFVIMAFSIGMLYQASGGTVRTLGDTEEAYRATLLAQSVLNSRDNVPEAGWNESGRSAGLSWSVTSEPFRSGVDSPKSAPLQQVRVVIGWTDRKGPRQMALSTLLPQTRAPAGAAR